VLHVEVPDARRPRFWFVVDPDDVSLCFTDPGHDVDATVSSSLGVLYQVWEGVIELSAAVRAGLVTLNGRRDVLLRLPDALVLSPVAPYVRRARAGLPAG
jgi:hypothetical protein